ncbi:MlaD family protein [Rhodococcus erythropolis]|uniref:MlaD family protein n=1 Tax=Rhodococcus erythropolis TaxID=1833 RepID=UPI00294A0451|nr:MlaD family protein [Rhodococcus erythropolis]MDV6211974.1 MlaD family protein [Rhodococcus erythropolis]
MITRTRISVLAMVALAALSVTYMARLGLPISPTTQTRAATMTVPDTNGLLVGSRVLLRGVEVGFVTTIAPNESGISIDWTYDDSYQIPVDSRIRVDNLSALGEPFVSVLPDTADGPYLENHAVIDNGKVTVPTPFTELSARLTELLKQIEPDQIQRIADTLNAGLPDGVHVINDLNRAGVLLAKQFTEQSDNMLTLMRAIQPLVMNTDGIPETLAATTPQMNAFGIGFQDLLQSIPDAMATGGPLLEGTRDGASPFFRELQKFLDANARDLETIGVNLLPAAQSASASMRTIDVGRLLGNLLSDDNPEGALTVHIPAGG